MKYLAILKDSFYETIDFKVFYILIGLSILLTLGVFCITFPRLPPEKALDNNLGKDRGHSGAGISEVEVVQESWFSPKGRYRFVMKPLHPQEFSRSIQNDIDQFARMQKEIRGESAPAERFPDRPAPEPVLPKTAEAQRQQVEQYLTSNIGFLEGKVLDLELDEAGQPKRIRVETEVSWAQLLRAHRVVYFFGAIEEDEMMLPLGAYVFGIQYFLVDWIAGIGGIIVAVIVTSFFVPNMLRKGTVDFLIVKPIARPLLLIYKYLGGLTFVFVNTAVLFTCTWFAFGITTDNWSPWYLASILVLTFYFAILYSMSVLVAVLTRSTIASILVTIGFWIFLSIVNAAYSYVTNPLRENQISDYVKGPIKAAHFLLPKPGDLTTLNQDLLWRGSGMEGVLGKEFTKMREEALERFSWSKTILTSLAFIAVMLGLGCWCFSRKDY